MDMSKFLTEIRKIVREEINIAMGEIAKKTDARIVEVLSKRLTESKITKQPQQKTGEKSLNKEQIKRIRESIVNSKASLKQQTPAKSQTKSVLPETLRSLPKSLLTALEETGNDMVSGKSSRILSDTGVGSLMEAVGGSGIQFSDIDSDDSYETAITMTTQNVAETSPMASNFNSNGDLPDFLSSAISRAGAIAKRAEEFTKSKG